MPPIGTPPAVATALPDAAPEMLVEGWTLDAETSRRNIDLALAMDTAPTTGV